MAWTTFRDFVVVVVIIKESKTKFVLFFFSSSVFTLPSPHCDYPSLPNDNCQRSHLWVPYKSGFSERQFTNRQSNDCFHLCLFLVHGLVISPAPDITNPDDTLNFNLNTLECAQTLRLGWVSVL